MQDNDNSLDSSQILTPSKKGMLLTPPVNTPNNEETNLALEEFLKKLDVTELSHREKAMSVEEVIEVSL